jgi:hypothetical protein
MVRCPIGSSIRRSTVAPGATSRYLGSTTVGECPRRASADGSAAATSASPPVLENGCASGVTMKTRKRLPASPGVVPTPGCSVAGGASALIPTAAESKGSDTATFFVARFGVVDFARGSLVVAVSAAVIGFSAVCFLARFGAVLELLGAGEPDAFFFDDIGQLDHVLK